MRTLYFAAVVSSFFLFFLAYLQRSQIGYLPYFHTWCGLSTNLECRSETCCTRLTEFYRTQKLCKKHHLCNIAQNCQAVSLQLRHVRQSEKKNLLTRNISSACPHSMVNVGPLTAEIGSGVWGTPANFDGFHVLASLLHRYHSMEVNQTLHDVLPSPGLLHYIYTVFHKKRGSQFMSMTIKS